MRTRVGEGGPQPTEVERMLGLAQPALAKDREWVRERRSRLAEADAALNEAFMALVKLP